MVGYWDDYRDKAGVKGMKSGSVFQEIEDDTMPGGPVKRTIEYVAPFTKCDREADYDEVWMNLDRIENTE